MPDPEYTPTVDQAKRAYVTGMRQAFIASAGEHVEEFARFLAARDVSVRAAALDEAEEVVKSQTPDPAEWGTEWAEGFEQATETSASAIRALKEEKK